MAYFDSTSIAGTLLVTSAATIQSTLNVSSSLTVSNINGSLLPKTDGSGTVGNLSYRWNAMYSNSYVLYNGSYCCYLNRYYEATYAPLTSATFYFGASKTPNYVMSSSTAYATKVYAYTTSSLSAGATTSVALSSYFTTIKGVLATSVGSAAATVAGTLTNAQNAAWSGTTVYLKNNTNGATRISCLVFGY